MALKIQTGNLFGLFSLLMMLIFSQAALAQTTAFSYQGKLTDTGNPANANYDLEFKLFDALVGGAQQGIQARNSVPASAGMFTVTLDFGSNVFSGANRYLEIGVRPANSALAYTILTPRQPILSTPYAIQSLFAVSATNFSGSLAGDVAGTQSATVLANGSVTTLKLADSSVTDAKIAAVAGSKVTGTIPVAGVPPGSTNYIQNSAILQASSNFNISGNGLIGGNVGIGTSNPILLNGASGKMLAISDLLNPGVALTNTANGGHQYFLYSSNVNGSLRVYDATIGVDRIVLLDNGNIFTNGNVVIGPDSLAQVKLKVDGGSDAAIRGISNTSIGVIGASLSSGRGVSGQSETNNGVDGYSTFGNGVYGGSQNGYAGYFQGKVRVTGVIEKAGGGFKIDHPLDPENKYLVHSFVESPDMKNLYDGTVTTDAKGEAEVTLPDWFAALNRDFRYQLTCLGVFAQAIIAEKIKNNRFKIKTSLPNVEVSWQVTGTRQDAWAKQNRLSVEVAKPEVERGFYQNPTAFGQPEERSIEWARHPEIMQQQKEQREKAAREQNNKDAAPVARPNHQ